MSFGIFLGFWPLLSSVLSLTGGASLSLEASRSPYALTLRTIRYQGVEGSDLRLARVDITLGARARFVEGGLGMAWLRLSSLGAVRDGLYPSLTGGVRFGKHFSVRVLGSITLARGMLWSAGVEMGFPLPLRSASSDG